MTADGIALRTAVPQDREAIVDLIQALNAFEADITGDRRRDRAAAEAYWGDLLARVARQQGRIVVAEARERIVGAMGFVIEEDEIYVTAERRRRGYVTDLVVDAAWRGRGVGRMLLAEAERLTRAAGLKRLMLGVIAGNSGAERAYAAFGFAPYATLMTKDLD